MTLKFVPAFIVKYPDRYIICCADCPYFHHYPSEVYYTDMRCEHPERLTSTNGFGMELVEEGTDVADIKVWDEIDKRCPLSDAH